MLRTRKDAQIKEDDPRATQYKARDQNERLFILRRRAPDGSEFVALFNLGLEPALLRISSLGIGICSSGEDYIVALDEGGREAEWEGIGQYRLWLNTDARKFGGTNEDQQIQFEIAVCITKILKWLPKPSLFFPKFRWFDAWAHLPDSSVD